MREAEGVRPDDEGRVTDLDKAAGMAKAEDLRRNYDTAYQSSQSAKAEAEQVEKGLYWTEVDGELELEGPVQESAIAENDAVNKQADVSYAVFEAGVDKQINKDEYIEMAKEEAEAAGHQINLKETPEQDQADPQ